MPFILQDGRLVEVTDAQYAEYTGIETQVRTTTAAERQALAEAEAAGGEIIQTTSTTDPANNQQIINPNTTTTTLTTVEAPLVSDSSTTAETIYAPPIDGAPSGASGFQRAAQEVQITTDELQAAGISDPRIIAPSPTSDVDTTDINFGATDVNDTGGTPTQNLGDLTSNDPGYVPPDEIRYNPNDVTDTGGVPTQSLSDLTSNDPGYVPPSEIQYGPDDVTDTGGVPTQSLSDLQSDTGGVPTQNLSDLTSNDPGYVPPEVLAAQQQAAKQVTQAAATLSKHKNQASQGDWRVRLRLAPGANYILTENSGILAPVQKTGGVIFPYLPQIQTSYVATYSNYDLTHSNYRGYFYQSSHVGEINITAPFTAQDTGEAAYLLAVIHFFRTVTKMFYGQNTPGRGSPPPLVFLQGLGEYQFNLHPCVVSQFSYNLPNDVDYIRTGPPNVDGTNMLARRDKQTAATNPWESAKQRLKAAGVDPGAIKQLPAPTQLGTKNPTYVPTKMEIQLTLLPIQSRDQVSKQFNMPGFANGDLVKGGFW